MDPKSSSGQRVSFRETFERNYITHGRALQEFLLKPSQLEGLDSTFRRSPYEIGVTILVYNRKDVEDRAIQVWGSLENLERERKNRDLKKKADELYSYKIKKNLRDSRRSETQNFQESSAKRKRAEHLVISIALLADFSNFIFKLVVFFITYSDSMLAESIHSAADTLNQTILVIGLSQMQQGANSRHPYGYSNMMYVVSLISGVGIFCLGAAVSVFNGILSLTIHRHIVFMEDIAWAFAALAFGTVTDATSLIASLVATYKGARKSKLGFFYYAFRGVEPGLTVILLEDLVAVLGNVSAASLLGVSLKTGTMVPDAVGSILIGILLGVVALFLIVTNTTALVGRSIPKERLENINKALEADVMIRAIYDVKGIDIGNKLVRYKAEIDFDGAELTRLYLDRQNLDLLLEEVKKIKDKDSLEYFMITHGESIVDLVGGEIDRIEHKVRNLFPEVRHMDLEIL